MTATKSEPDQQAAVDMFEGFGRAARGTAVKNRTKGDMFGETLAEARAQVYEKAAELVRTTPVGEAAVEMMNRAKAAHVRTPPLMNFDAAGVQYTIARAWQFCAWRINPDLSEVARSWDEEYSARSRTARR